MGVDLQTLIENPVLPIGLLFVGALIGIQIEQIVSKQRRAEWKRKNAWRFKEQGKGKAGPWVPKPDATTAKPKDAADQLRTVMKADFKAQALLNKTEARLFKMIDKWVIELRPGWQVMAQVSLGEILKCDDREAYWCINAKRVDLLIVDEDCKPIHAIEYQGRAHYKGAHHTAARDAVKKEALRRAGIGYLEVNPGDTPAELRRVVDRLVQKAS